MKNKCDSIYALEISTRGLKCHVITGLMTHILCQSPLKVPPSPFLHKCALCYCFSKKKKKKKPDVK